MCVCVRAQINFHQKVKDLLSIRKSNIYLYYIVCGESRTHEIYIASLYTASFRHKPLRKSISNRRVMHGKWRHIGNVEATWWRYRDACVHMRISFAQRWRNIEKLLTRGNSRRRRLRHVLLFRDASRDKIMITMVIRAVSSRPFGRPRDLNFRCRCERHALFDG